MKVGNTSTDDYAEYVKACEEAGFTVDYSKYDESYSASNAEGYKLSLRYIGFNTMEVSIEVPEETMQIESNDDKSGTENNEDSSTDNNTGNDNVGTDETTETKDNNTELVDGMRPEFKEAMDSYEAFYVEYCDFMKKYAENPTDLGLLAEYSDMVEELAEMDNKFAAWDDGTMNNAELQYYAVVNGRVTKMLLEIAQ